MALAESSNTKKLFGSKKRFATEEMLLRFFALSHNLGEYNGKLSQFLNDFMFKKRYIDENELSILSNIYNETVLFINDKIMEKIKTKAFGKTFLE